jgi:FMN reductase [NAD(P)H]
MDFSDVLARRRMVRNYRPDPVDHDTLSRIVAAGTRAPSAGFSQGHRFVVVTAPERRAELATLAGEDRYVQRGFDPWLSSAPAHIVVCVSEAAYRDRYSQPDKSPDALATVPYWWVDAGAALMAILLAAVDEGLGAGFLGAHAVPGLGDALDLPPDVAPLGIVTVGHPAPDRPSTSVARGRRPTSELVHWQRWDGEPERGPVESDPCNTAPPPET